MNVATRGYVIMLAILLAGLAIGWWVGKKYRHSGVLAGMETFVDVKEYNCRRCGSSWDHCECPGGNPVDHAQCPQIDWSKYVLKASIPACPPQPDMSRYMLKSECPAPPDMSKYILKSAVPPCPPCISTCNKPCKIGECPPCPRPRCPEVKCPPATKCPACAPCPRTTCPPAVVKCKAEEVVPSNQYLVRPYLTPLGSSFGSD
jgi:hypothetical protein